MLIKFLQIWKKRKKTCNIHVVECKFLHNICCSFTNVKIAIQMKLLWKYIISYYTIKFHTFKLVDIPGKLNRNQSWQNTINSFIITNVTSNKSLPIYWTFTHVRQLYTTLSFISCLQQKRYIYGGIRNVTFHNNRIQYNIVDMDSDPWNIIMKKIT